MPISERPEQVLTDEDIEFLFTYHPPTDETIPKFNAINQAAKDFARVIRDNVPQGPDRTIAVRTLQRLRMDCNAAISLCWRL